MELSDQRWQDVGILEVVVVVGPIHVGRHGANEIATVLPTVGLTHLDARNLGDRIPLIGGFERPGEQGFLLERLRREPGIDAGAPEEEKFRNAGTPRAMDEVVLDLKILVEE